MVPRMLDRRLLLAGLLTAATSAAAAQDKAQPQLPTEPLRILTATGKTLRFDVEVADTYAERERGLMFRKSVPANGGMLFDFRIPQPVAFWMKNTLIPLDMLFIAEDGRIVNIAANTTPLSTQAIPSDGPIRGVLELRGGRAAELGITAGSLVKHRIFKPS